MIQPIRLFGDPVLRQRAVEVVDFDKELRKLVEDLTDTMLEAPGAGLAAPQIGVRLRVFQAAQPPHGIGQFGLPDLMRAGVFAVGQVQ